MRVLALLLAMSLTPTTAASRAAPRATRQTLFGMNVPSREQLHDSESALGVRAAIVADYADWAHAPQFPRRWAEAINARGGVPLIGWEPWDSWRGGADQPRYALRRIIAGGYDSLIERWATEIADYRRPVMLRFALEMNGNWYPWATGVNGNRSGEFVAAWRHVRAQFRRARAKNAIFVWSPNVAYHGTTPLRGLFPGAREVDWLAVDGYNWGALSDSGWQTYRDLFAPTVRALRALAPRKPMMIAETGCGPDPRKPGWVTDTLRSARADRLNAVVWFEFDKETDWRLAGDSATAEAAAAVLKGRGWRKGGDLAAIDGLLGKSR